MAAMLRGQRSVEIGSGAAYPRSFEHVLVRVARLVLLHQLDLLIAEAFQIGEVTAELGDELAVARRPGELRGDETLEATATITVRGISEDVLVTGTIALS